MINWFNRFFRRGLKAGQPDIDVKTVPLSEEQLQTVNQEPPAIHPPQYIVGVGQSVGLQREHNEDTLFALSTVLADGNSDIPYGIFIVADGMGGHQHGELASAVATRTMANTLISQLYRTFLGTQSGSQAASLQEIMERGVAEAQAAVISKVPGGGTTLTAAVTIGEQVVLAHVGDSRAYFIYLDGRIQPVTQDHSLVQRLLELGEITDEEARSHPQRNVLYRAIGQNEPLRADIKLHPLPHPGYLLLCSDGLWGVVPESQILHLIRSTEDPSQACRLLIDAANELGGPDNISAILVHFPA